MLMMRKSLLRPWPTKMHPRSTKQRSCKYAVCTPATCYQPACLCKCVCACVAYLQVHQCVGRCRRFKVAWHQATEPGQVVLDGLGCGNVQVHDNGNVLACALERHAAAGGSDGTSSCVTMIPMRCPLSRAPPAHLTRPGLRRACLCTTRWPSVLSSTSSVSSATNSASMATWRSKVNQSQRHAQQQPWRHLYTLRALYQVTLAGEAFVQLACAYGSSTRAKQQGHAWSMDQPARCARLGCGTALLRGGERKDAGRYRHGWPRRHGSVTARLCDAVFAPVHQQHRVLPFLWTSYNVSYYVPKHNHVAARTGV